MERLEFAGLSLCRGAPERPLTRPFFLRIFVRRELCSRVGSGCNTCLTNICAICGRSALYRARRPRPSPLTPERRPEARTWPPLFRRIGYATHALRPASAGRTRGGFDGRPFGRSADKAAGMDRSIAPEARSAVNKVPGKNRINRPSPLQAAVSRSVRKVTALRWALCENAVAGERRGDSDADTLCVARVADHPGSCSRCRPDAYSG